MEPCRRHGRRISRPRNAADVASEEDIQYDCAWMTEDDKWVLDTKSWIVLPKLQYPQRRESEKKALDALMKAIAQERASLRYR